jgi:hypothetical protein
MESARRPPLPTPTQPHRPTKGDISTWPDKRTFLLCLDIRSIYLLDYRSQKSSYGLHAPSPRRPADEPGPNLPDRISGFGGKDKIDFAQVSFAVGNHAVDNSGKVSIQSSARETVATFKVSGTYAPANFHVGKDASGHILVTHGGKCRNRWSWRRKLCGPSWRLRFPASETSGGAVGLESLLPPVPGAATYAGGLAHHHEGNIGGARDAWASAGRAQSLATGLDLADNARRFSAASGTGDGLTDGEEVTTRKFEVFRPRRANERAGRRLRFADGLAALRAGLATRSRRG